MSGAASYILSVHRQTDDNYEFEVRITATNFTPGNLNTTIPGSPVNPSQTSALTYLIPNTRYNWWVRAVDANGVAGAWSSVKTFEYANTAMLKVGLHAHLGYPRELGSLVDQLSGTTNWAIMDNPALTQHANTFGTQNLVHSGLNWQVSYHPFQGWSSANSAESNTTLTNLSMGLVLHPITLPEALPASYTSFPYKNDFYGHLNRKTLALIGAQVNESDLVQRNPLATPAFGFGSGNPYYRFRVPGMFQIRNSKGVIASDSELYNFDFGANGPSYVQLTFAPVTTNSYEGWVESLYLNFLVDVALKSGGKAKYVLLGNEPESQVHIHPQIYARLIDKAATKFSGRPEKIVLANFARGVNHLAYLDVVKQEFLKIYANRVSNGKIYGVNCPFQASSIDFYLKSQSAAATGDKLDYDEIARQAGLYKAKVKELRDLFVNDTRPLEFFIKEASFDTDYYTQTGHTSWLAIANGSATGPLPDGYKSEIKTFISFLKQLGFAQVAWFNQIGTPLDHGNLLYGTRPVSGTTMSETPLGSYLRSLN